MKFKRVFNLQRVMLDKKTMFRYCLPETGGAKLNLLLNAEYELVFMGILLKVELIFEDLKTMRLGGERQSEIVLRTQRIMIIFFINHP